MEIKSLKDSPAFTKRDEKFYPKEYNNRVPKKIKFLEDVTVVLIRNKTYTFKKGDELDYVYTEECGCVNINHVFGWNSVYENLNKNQYEIIEWHPFSSYYEFLLKLGRVKEKSEEHWDVSNLYVCIIKILGEKIFNQRFDGHIEYTDPKEYDKGDVFASFHKMFRQCDTAQNIYRRDGKEAVELNGEVDSLFHSIICNDTVEVFYNIFNEVGDKLRETLKLKKD